MATRAVTDRDHEPGGAHSSAAEPVEVRAGWWRIIWQALMRLFADEAVPLAGNIAFRILLSAFPFLIFLTALAGFVGDQRLATELVNYLLSVAPADIVAPLVPEIRAVLTRPRGGILSVGVLLTIWTASGGVDSVRVGLNRAYNLKEHRSTLVLFLQNVLFVLAGAIVMIAVALLIVLAPIVKAAIVNYVPGADHVPALYDAARYPFAVAVLAVGLTMAHIFLPARWRRLSDLWPGITLTIVVWVGLAWIYSLYLGHFASFASTYAGLAGIMAAMIFLYLGALVMIFGGEINRAVRLRRKAREAEAAGT